MGRLLQAKGHRAVYQPQGWQNQERSLGAGTLTSSWIHVACCARCPPDLVATLNPTPKTFKRPGLLRVGSRLPLLMECPSPAPALAPWLGCSDSAANRRTAAGVSGPACTDNKPGQQVSTPRIWQLGMQSSIPAAMMAVIMAAGQQFSPHYQLWGGTCCIQQCPAHVHFELVPQQNAQLACPVPGLPLTAIVCTAMAFRNCSDCSMSSIARQWGNLLSSAAEQQQLAVELE